MNTSTQPNNESAPAGLTPESDMALVAGTSILLNGQVTGGMVDYDFSRRLERERDEARRAERDAQLQMVEDNKTIIDLRQQLDRAQALNIARIDHENVELKSDSIVASCNCQVKTNEIKYHQPGCKYRLICERDDARAQLTACQQRAGADGLREAASGWFLMKLSGENCLTTLVDVFTEIREDLEDADGDFAKTVRAALSASPASREGDNP